MNIKNIFSKKAVDKASSSGKTSKTPAVTVETIAAQPSKTKKYLVLAFFLPFFIMGTVFALNQFYPFGDQQFLVVDLWHQMYPFLVELQYKLQHGTSLLYDWGTGLGNNYPALAAYYLSSPLNLLTVFVPEAFLREAMELFMLVKVGCAGLFFAVFLKGVFKRNDFSISFFGILYALCAYTLGYYWCIIWFDTVALLPLVMYGLYSLVKEGKYKLYVISLALSLICNFYIGFFTCIFTAIIFFALCITQKLKFKQFLKRLWQIALFSVIGIGISTILTVPAYMGLQHAYSANGVFPKSEFPLNIINVLSKLNTMIEPNTKEGLPNIYCGIICVLLLGVFLVSKKISLRSKIVDVSVCAFLILSFDSTTLNYIWHGFHITNMLPYRYSFLFSFMLIVMAYRAFMLLPSLKTLDIVVMGGIAALFICFASISNESQTALIGTIIFMCVYLLIMFLYQKRIFNIKFASACLFVVIFAEASINCYIGVKTVGHSQRSIYPADNQNMTTLVDQMKQMEDDLFYRAEMTSVFTHNDSTLYHFNGISEFSSTVNANITYYMEGLGLIGNGPSNRYGFVETSPFTSSLLDVQYLFSRGKDAKDMDNWTKVGTSGTCYLYKNNFPLSLGFMTKNDAAYFLLDKDNPFNTQNDLFKKATGLTTDLFDPVDIIHVGHVNYDVGRTSYGNYVYTPQDKTKVGTLKWNYQMPRTGELFVYTYLSAAGNSVKLNVSCNNGPATSYETKRPAIFSAGKFAEGDLISLSMDMEAGKQGTARIYAQMLNQDAWEEGYKTLSDEMYNITDFSTTEIKGNIDVKEDGLFYTSISYESGWSAYVDGVKTEITPIHDAVTAFQLTKGTHEITFKYSPEGFMPSVCIMLFSIAAFVAIIIVQNRIRKKNGKDIMVCSEPIEDIYVVTEESEAPPKTTGKKKKKK